MRATDASQDLLTDDEVRAVGRAAVKGRPQGVPEDELYRVVRWACQARIDATLLDMVLRDDVWVSALPGEDVMFRLPGQPMRTPRVWREADEILRQAQEHDGND